MITLYTHPVLYANDFISAEFMNLKPFGFIVTYHPQNKDEKSYEFINFVYALNHNDFLKLLEYWNGEPTNLKKLYSYKEIEE